MIPSLATCQVRCVCVGRGWIWTCLNICDKVGGYLSCLRRRRTRVLLGIYKIGQTVGKLATTFVLHNIIRSPITTITLISLINFEFHLNRKFTRLFLDNVEWQELNSQFQRVRTPWTGSRCLHRGCTGRLFRQCSTQRSSVLQYLTNWFADLFWTGVKSSVLMT